MKEYMTKEELIEFLKENLSINVSMSRDYEYGSTYISTTVELLLGNERISIASESTSID